MIARFLYKLNKQKKILLKRLDNTIRNSYN